MSIRKPKPKKEKTASQLRIVAIIAEILLPSDESLITPGATLQEDLGADSLDLIELSMHLEEEFGMEIDEVAAAKLLTVQDVFDYVEKNAAVPA